MNETTEINKLIAAVKRRCPDIKISALTNFGEEGGVWKFWHENNADVYVKIEVQQGLIYAIYASTEFKDKYPVDAVKICQFLNAFI